MTKRQRTMVGVIQLYKEELGKKVLDMREVADWAVRRGMKLPEPSDPMDILAREFARAAREETRRDPITGKPYRAYHAVPSEQNPKQMSWLDIDDNPPRHAMKKSFVLRREQMIGDGVQLSLDIDRWNNLNPNEEKIDLPMDFTEDIEWRKNAPGEDEADAAE